LYIQSDILKKKGEARVKKDKTFLIRMSEKDFEIIQKKAELEDVSISEFMRVASVNKRVPGFSKELLKNRKEQLPGQYDISDLEN